MSIRKTGSPVLMVYCAALPTLATIAERVSGPVSLSKVVSLKTQLADSPMPAKKGHCCASCG